MKKSANHLTKQLRSLGCHVTAPSGQRDVGSISR